MLQRHDVMHLFARQHGVASQRQLADLGVSAWSVARSARVGEIERVVGTVVVGVPGRHDSAIARSTALHLAADGNGYVSGQTAGLLHGLRRMRAEPVEYTIHFRTRFVVPSWARLVRSSWPDEEWRPQRNDGLVVASPLRTLLDLAATLPQQWFARAAEDAWHRGLVTPDVAHEYLARVRRSGRAGVTAMEKWLECASTQKRPATTGLEQLLIDLAERAGLPQPERQHGLRLRSGVTVHLDIAWPDVRLALEPGHSWWHGGDAQQRADQDRDRECSELGWLVLRFDESAWNRRRQIVGQLERTYAERRRLFRPPAAAEIP